MMRVPFVNLSGQYEACAYSMQMAFERVMDTAAYIRGPELERFEKEFARYIGASHAVGVGCGGDALYLALRALGVGPEAEVIVPVNTYIATAFAVSRTGATPVFVDCDETYNINPDLIPAAITGSTRAIIPVHLTGQAANMDAVYSSAAEQLLIVEDAAQATGATYKGQRCGSLGDIGCFSFYPSKNLGACGDGGMVVTNDHALAAELRVLRDYGQDHKYHHIKIGVNSLLDSLQAALLTAKLPRLDEWNEQRRKLAAHYKELLEGCPAISGYQAETEGAEHVYHLFVVESPFRDALQEFLAEREIQTGIHYPTPIHKQPAYAKRYGHLSFPVAEHLARVSLSLPMCPYTTMKQVEYVCTSIWEYARR